MVGETFIDAVVDRVAARAQVAQVEVAPSAVLWPDRTREWEPLIRQVSTRIRLLSLGDYVPDQHSGPAYWIRCVIDGTIQLDAAPDGVPVIYLPGYARTDIRAVEDADDTLKPLAELLYRGTTFAHQNGRDWTISGFLEAKTNGLGVDVADDQATKEALLRAASALGNVSVDELRREAPLKAAYFDSLMTPDLDRQVLQCMNDRMSFEATCSAQQLEAFKSALVDQFNSDLNEGEIALASHLGLGGGRWSKVWDRYAEAPARYPHIEDLLALAMPERTGKTRTLFEGVWGRYPQDNAEDEDRLRSALTALSAVNAKDSRATITALENEHGGRRGWIWTTLGRAPLATAIGHLARLAQTSNTVAAPADCFEAATSHTMTGWRVDDAVIRALASVRTEADRQAVTNAIRPIYEPWLDETARRFQAVVAAGPYRVPPVADWPSGTCLVFFDGLRYDIAARLQENLVRSKRDAKIEPRLTALPTLTATAKPAVSPVAGELHPGKYFAPAAKDGGADVGVATLRTLLVDAGYQVLKPGETGDPSGRAWTEQGDLDEIGHLEPWNLPEQAEREIEKLTERIEALLTAGWTQVVVVTDHGWLYLPGGLPKVDFPLSVTKDDRGRKGRTARLGEGAQAPGETVPWFWDPNVRIAVAPGISTFVAGDVYQHGGVSPQECVTPVVTVRNPASRPGPVDVSVEWAGLRARISVSGAPEARVDLRRKAGDETTSVAGSPRAIDEHGSVSILVADEDLEGTLAFVVVLDGAGGLLAQMQTVVGGD